MQTDTRAAEPTALHDALTTHALTSDDLLIAALLRLIQERSNGGYVPQAMAHALGDLRDARARGDSAAAEGAVALLDAALRRTVPRDAPERAVLRVVAARCGVARGRRRTRSYA